MFTAPYEEIGKTERVPMKISCSRNYSFSGDFKSPYGVVDMFEFKPRPIPMIYPMENVKFSVVKKGENFIELDAGNYVTAKPSFEVAKGDAVKIIYSECYVFDGEKEYAMILMGKSRDILILSTHRIGIFALSRFGCTVSDIYGLRQNALRMP